MSWGSNCCKWVTDVTVVTCNTGATLCSLESSWQPLLLLRPFLALDWIMRLESMRQCCCLSWLKHWIENNNLFFIDSDFCCWLRQVCWAMSQKRVCVSRLLSSPSQHKQPCHLLVRWLLSAAVWLKWFDWALGCQFSTCNWGVLQHLSVLLSCSNPVMCSIWQSSESGTWSVLHHYALCRQQYATGKKTPRVAKTLPCNGYWWQLPSLTIVALYAIQYISVMWYTEWHRLAGAACDTSIH